MQQQAQEITSKTHMQLKLAAYNALINFNTSNFFYLLMQVVTAFSIFNIQYLALHCQHFTQESVQYIQSAKLKNKTATY